MNHPKYLKCLVFNITPIGKPRMVRSDRWSDRPAVLQYWAYKDELNLLAHKNRYTLGDTLDIIFYIPMPRTWSKKKQEAMNGKPHQQKPDADNLVKAFMDCLSGDDAGVWNIRIRKYWSLDGQ